jgi:hypothetical protein
VNFVNLFCSGLPYVQGRVFVTVHLACPSVPLIIDLDGTLLRSDMLLETGMAFVRHKPLSLFKVFGWLAKGKAALKEGLALANPIDVSVLPFDPVVLELIEGERCNGRTIVLATASHQSWLLMRSATSPRIARETS